MNQAREYIFSAISLYLQQSKLYITVIQLMNAIYVCTIDSIVRFITGRYMTYEYDIIYMNISN